MDVLPFRLWVDDIRKPPNSNYDCWSRSVIDALFNIGEAYGDCLETNSEFYLELDLDHDAGDYREQGGDYIKILDFIEEFNNKVKFYPIHISGVHIHSMNPVGVANMRAIVERNHWKEIL